LNETKLPRIAVGAGLNLCHVRGGKLVNASFGRQKLAHTRPPRKSFSPEPALQLPDRKEIPYEEVFTGNPTRFRPPGPQTLELWIVLTRTCGIRLDSSACASADEEVGPRSSAPHGSGQRPNRLPREAMGLGDQETFMAAIGAFLGWKGRGVSFSS